MWNLSLLFGLDCSSKVEFIIQKENKNLGNISKHKYEKHKIIPVRLVHASKSQWVFWYIWAPTVQWLSTKELAIVEIFAVQKAVLVNLMPRRENPFWIFFFIWKLLFLKLQLWYCLLMLIFREFNGHPFLSNLVKGH